MDMNELTKELLDLGTSIVADAMLRLGVGIRSLSPTIRAMSPESKCCGPAFTIRGTTNASHESKLRGLGLLDGIFPTSVVVIDGNGPSGVGHWGELLTAAALARGAAGAVVHGGTRDVAEIRRLGFPVFAEYATPCEAISLYCMDVTGIPLELPSAVGGKITIHPNDIMLCDEDGCVVIPAESALKTLTESREIKKAETIALHRLLAGDPVRDVFELLKIA